MKVVAIANGILALPSVQTLAEHNMLAGLCTMELADESTQNIQFLANRHQIPLLVVNEKHNSRNLERWLKRLQPDVVFVLTYGYRISPSILSIPAFGFYNFHFGQLPQYRGPQPIFWELLNREAEGAISVHKMDAQIDHGPTAIVAPIPIDPADTFGMHTVKLAFAAVTIVHNLISLLQSNPKDLALQEQDHTQAHYYPRPTLQDLIIDWEGSESHSIQALIKASNPWNQGAFTSIKGINLRILEGAVVDGEAGAAAGTIITANPEHGLVVQCKDGQAIRLEIVRMEEGFLLGTKLLELGLKPGDSFGLPGSI